MLTLPRSQLSVLLGVIISILDIDLVLVGAIAFALSTLALLPSLILVIALPGVIVHFDLWNIERIIAVVFSLQNEVFMQRDASIEVIS